jgi:RimJ/RimL family protein N-acetyltransferase
MKLRGRRVSIRPVAWNDLPTMCRWWNDPTVMREVRAEKFKPTLEHIQNQAWPVWRDPGMDDYHEFVICLGDRIIGEIGYIYKELNQHGVSVDIKIGDPSLWGQGLGTEAMSLFVSYLFDRLQAQHVMAQPGDWNTRSMRLFKKCGFMEIRREEIAATDVHDGGMMVTMQCDKEQ